MLTGPVPWSIPNAVIRSGSIGYKPKLGTPKINKLIKILRNKTYNTNMYLLLNVGWLFSEHSLYIRLTLGRFFYTAQSLLLKYRKNIWLIYIKIQNNITYHLEKYGVVQKRQFYTVPNFVILWAHIIF